MGRTGAARRGVTGVDREEGAHRGRSAREDIDIFGRGARIAAEAGGVALRVAAAAGTSGRGNGVRARRGSRLSLPDPAVSMATSSARISRERPEA